MNKTKQNSRLVYSTDRRELRKKDRIMDNPVHIKEREARLYNYLVSTGKMNSPIDWEKFTPREE